MAGYNKVVLVGNLTRDPELRYTPKGLAIAKLGLAVNRSWRDSTSGEMKEEVTFIDIDAFGKQAETLGQYMKKGSPILIEGRLRLDTWEDKQTNQKRSKLGVVLEEFRFLDSGRGRDGGAGEPGKGRPSGPDPAPDAGPKAADAGSAEDDVPF